MTYLARPTPAGADTPRWSAASLALDMVYGIEDETIGIHLAEHGLPDSREARDEVGAELMLIRRWLERRRDREERL